VFRHTFGSVFGDQLVSVLNGFLFGPVQPKGGLVELKGKFYGTTSGGGSVGDFAGTVYSTNPTSDKSLPLHTFCKYCRDGSLPEAALISVNGTLYGTTEYGGTGKCSRDGYSGCGTVFAITP
jgi:uncharacterized repeat protein (TIGR03803 family)